MTTPQKEKQFIYVGGAPRSGTTLLQNMLDSHPDILGGPEFIHLPDIISLRTALHGSIDRKWIDLFCSCEDVDIALRSLIEQLMLSLASEHPWHFLSEKTPGNVLVFSELLDLFADAHFIFMVRDPRAIVSSMLKVGQQASDKGVDTASFTQNVRAAIKYTAKCFDAGFTAVHKAPDRATIMVYENLVVNPEAESRRICKFLGIDWVRQMMYPGRFDHLGQQAITKHSEQIWYDAASYNRDPEPNHVKKWQKQLALWQQVYVTRAFENDVELKKLGYDLTLDHISQAHYYNGLVQQQFRQWVSKASRKFLP